MAVWFWRIAGDILLKAIHTFVSVKRGVPLEETELGPVLAYPASARAPRSRMAGVALWLLRSAAYLVLAVLGGAIFKNVTTAYDDAYMLANATYNEAVIGTANGKCGGVLTEAQAAACNRYQFTLSQAWVAQVGRKFLYETMPSCGVVNCKDIYAYVADSWTAYVLFVAVNIALVVVIVRVVNALVNACSRCASAEHVHASEARQVVLREHLPPALRHTVDTIPRINSMPQSPVVVDLDMLREVRQRTLVAEHPDAHET